MWLKHRRLNAPGKAKTVLVGKGFWTIDGYIYFEEIRDNRHYITAAKYNGFQEILEGEPIPDYVLEYFGQEKQVEPVEKKPAKKGRSKGKK